MKTMTRYEPPPDLDYRDREVRALVERHRRKLSFKAISDLSRESFGNRRAWSPVKVNMYMYYTSRGRRNRLPTTIIGRDGQIRQFIENRAGQLSVSEIARLVGERFTGRRLPSRGSVARFIAKLRRERNVPHF